MKENTNKVAFMVSSSGDVSVKSLSKIPKVIISTSSGDITIL
jgi:hypothetical protein